MKYSICIALLSVSFIACGDDLPEGCDHYVEPSADDQAMLQGAFIDAQDGDTVCLAAGTFTLSDPLEMSGRSDVTIRGEGMDATTLDFSGQDAGGTGLDFMSMTRFTIQDLHVVDASGNGIRVNASDGVHMLRVRAGWTNESDSSNGKYALYPVSSSNVIVDACEAYNSSDAGIYVGQATGCIVRNSRAWGNVAGIEIENSLDCDVYDNTAEDNTGGLLVFELPGLPLSGGGVLVRDNIIRNNNLPSFADPGAIVSVVPAGTGLFFLAANDIEVRGNTISNNRSLGVGMVAYDIVLTLQGETDSGDSDYDGYNENIYVHDNMHMGNGSMPGSMTDSGPDSLGLMLALIEGKRGAPLEMLEEVVWGGIQGDVETVLCLGDSPPTFRNLGLDTLLESDPYDEDTNTTPHECTLPERAEVTLEWQP